MGFRICFQEGTSISPILCLFYCSSNSAVPASNQLSAAELQAPIDRANPISSPSSPQPPNVPVLNGNGFNGARPNHVHHLEAPNLQRSASESSSIPGGFELSEEDEREDWGGDLMDVNDDEGDWGKILSFWIYFAFVD